MPSNVDASIAKAIDDVRGTMRWVLATFGGVAVAVIAKINFFTDIGALSPKNARLAAWSLAAATVGVVIVIVRAAFLYRRFQPSIDGLRGPSRGRIRRGIESDPLFFFSSRRRHTRY